MSDEPAKRRIGWSQTPAVDRGARRNFLWAALNGALFESGASFADPGTVVATFLNRLNAGATAVGAAAAIARFGWLLPQLFTANYARARRFRKPIYLVGGTGRALCLGLLATVLVAWPGLADHDSQPRLLVVFFVLWTVFSFVSGLAGVPPTVEDAESYQYSLREQMIVEHARRWRIAGAPKQVREQFTAFAAKHGVDELVVVTITEDAKTRLRSYELLAEVFDLEAAKT